MGDCGVVEECGGQEAGEGQSSQHLRPEAEYVICPEDGSLERSRGEEVIDSFLYISNGVTTTFSHCECL